MRGAYGDDPITQGAWDVLLREGWLVREERWGRPADRVWRFARQDAPLEARLDASRRLLTSVLHAQLGASIARGWGPMAGADRGERSAVGARQ